MFCRFSQEKFGGSFLSFFLFFLFFSIAESVFRCEIEGVVGGTEIRNLYTLPVKSCASSRKFSACPK